MSLQNVVVGGSKRKEVTEKRCEDKSLTNWRHENNFMIQRKKKEEQSLRVGRLWGVVVVDI